MTRDDFQEWYRFVSECFTGIEPWLSRIVKTGENPPTRKAILHKWFLALEEVSLEGAKAATTRIHAGEIEEPKGFDRFPAAVRRAAGVSRHSHKYPWDEVRHTSDGSQTYACLLCRDSGYVRCWHPKTVALVAWKGLSPHGIRYQPLYSCAIRCTCHAGNLRPQVGEAPRFDSKHALPLDGNVSDRTEQQKLVDWLANHEPIRPANYEPALANFGGKEF